MTDASAQTSVFADADAALARAGIRRTAFCAAAKIHTSTWYRLRTGRSNRCHPAAVVTVAAAIGKLAPVLEGGPELVLRFAAIAQGEAQADAAPADAA